MSKPNEYDHLIKAFQFRDIFSEIRLFLMYASYLIYSLNEGFDQRFGITYVVSDIEEVTFFAKEFPQFEPTKRNELGKNMLKVFVSGIFNKLYESLNKENRFKNTELVAFFYQIRNALSHNGIFQIPNGTLENKQKTFNKVPKWRNKEITYAIHGTDIFSFISFGEFFVLLEDLEKEVNGIKGNILDLQELMEGE